MIDFDKTPRWYQYADSEAGPLGRHMERMVSRRRVASTVTRAGTERESLLALVPIGMLTLFMLWAVLNPV